MIPFSTRQPAALAIIPAAETIRAMLRAGLDTAEIASNCGVREADIWNALAGVRERPSLLRRIFGRALVERSAVT